MSSGYYNLSMPYYYIVSASINSIHSYTITMYGLDKYGLILEKKKKTNDFRICETERKNSKTATVVQLIWSIRH